MFDLKNTEKYKSKDERRLKTATVLVAAVTIGFYIVFILLMVITKFGILSAFIHTKPVVNSVTICEDSFYDYLNFDFYYKRFNWLFDGNYDRLYFVYNFDLIEDDNSIFDSQGFSKIGWSKIVTGSEEFDSVKLLLNLREVTDSDNIRYFTLKTQGYSRIPITIIGITTFGIFGLFLLISSAVKIINITKSYHNGKLEFQYGTLGVKICCILEIIGLIAVTYVFFWLLLWEIPIFYNVTEPSIIYYLLFMLPVITLNTLFASLYIKAANLEE